MKDKKLEDAKHAEKKAPSKSEEKRQAVQGLEKAAAQSEDPAKVLASEHPEEVAGPTRDAHLPPSEDEQKAVNQEECDSDGCGKLEQPAQGTVDGNKKLSDEPKPKAHG